VDESDIGAVAATVLTKDGHGGTSYHLTGPEVLTPRQMVGIIGEATGRRLRFEELTPDQVRQEWGRAGKRPALSIFRALTQAGPLGDAELVEILLRMYGTPNEFGTTLSDHVEQVTGRPPRTYAQWAREHAHRFELRTA
jgi:hypothetical protein